MKAIRLPYAAPSLCVVAAALSLTRSIPAAEPSAFTVTAERPSITAFVGIEELNRIVITGIHPESVTLAVTIGVGEFKMIGGEWYWTYQPQAEDVTSSSFVKFEARPIGFTAPSRRTYVTADFILSIESRRWASEYPYFPLKDRYPAGYVGVPVKMNFKCKGMNGEYHIMVYKNGEYWRDVYEPIFEFIPAPDDVGRKIAYEVYYRSSPKAASVLFHENDFVIEHAPFTITHDQFIRPGGYVRLSVWIGTQGSYVMPQSPFLIIDSDGFLADTAYHIRNYTSGLFSERDDAAAFFDRVRRDARDTNIYATYDYLVRVTKKMKAVARKDSHVRFTVTDPATGKRCESEILVATK